MNTRCDKHGEIEPMVCSRCCGDGDVANDIDGSYEFPCFQCGGSGDSYVCSICSDEE